MSGLMACRMLRLALARIPSSRGTRLIITLFDQHTNGCFADGFVFAGYLGECLLYRRRRRSGDRPIRCGRPGWSREQQQSHDTQRCNGATKRDHHDGELSFHKTHE